MHISKAYKSKNNNKRREQEAITKRQGKTRQNATRQTQDKTRQDKTSEEPLTATEDSLKDFEDL